MLNYIYKIKGKIPLSFLEKLKVLDDYLLSKPFFYFYSNHLSSKKVKTPCRGAGNFRA